MKKKKPELAGVLQMKEALLAGGITFLFMIVADILGYKDAIQNITLYFVLVVWLKNMRAKNSAPLDAGVMPNKVIAGKELYKYISKRIGECDTAMKKNKEQNTPIQKVEYADNRSMQIAYEDIFKRIKSQREA